jgi:hypothetical protein
MVRLKKANVLSLIDCKITIDYLLSGGVSIDLLCTASLSAWEGALSDISVDLLGGVWDVVSLELKVIFYNMY